MELETLLCSPCFPIKTQSCAAGDALTFIFGNRKNSKGAGSQLDSRSQKTEFEPEKKIEPGYER